MRKSFVLYPFEENDGDLQNARDIMLKHSWTSVLFLSLVTAKVFFTATPRLFDDILVFLILIATLPLAQPYIHKRYKKICYIVIIFYLMDAAKTYIWFSSAQYRIYLLAEAALVIGALYYFTHPYQQTFKMAIGRFGRQLIRLTPLLYVLSAISIISNLLGYTNLTDLTLKICTQGSILTVIFFGTLLIVKGISTSSVHRHYSRMASYNIIKKRNLHLKSLKVLRTIAVICWAIVFLGLIDVLRPLNDFLKDMLTEPYRMGSITFTLGTVFTFLLILAVSFLITNFVAYIFDDAETGPLKVLQLPKGIPAAISLVIRYLIIAFGIILALSTLGVDLSEFNLMAGALGLGIGFGLQTVISNFVSGIILVFERPILPGDTVEVNNLLGVVNRIGVRSSSISTFDGAEVVVPNNSLISNDLINWTLSNNIKRIEVLVGASYDSDPNSILKILAEAAAGNAEVLKNPPPQALFSEFGDSSLNFRLRFWVHYEVGLQTKSEVSIAIYNRFKEQGIEIPFPQRDVHIKEVPAKSTGISNLTE
jgi:small-conductance mechanosensitive channel